MQTGLENTTIHCTQMIPELSIPPTLIPILTVLILACWQVRYDTYGTHLGSTKQQHAECIHDYKTQNKCCSYYQLFFCFVFWHCALISIFLGKGSQYRFVLYRIASYCIDIYANSIVLSFIAGIAHLYIALHIKIKYTWVQQPVPAWFIYVLLLPSNLQSLNLAMIIEGQLHKGMPCLNIQLLPVIQIRPAIRLYFVHEIQLYSSSHFPITPAQLMRPKTDPVQLVTLYTIQFNLLSARVN